MAVNNNYLVRKQREIQSVFFLKIEMLVYSINRDPHDLDAEIVVLLDISFEALSFNRTALCEISLKWIIFALQIFHPNYSNKSYYISSDTKTAFKIISLSSELFLVYEAWNPLTRFLVLISVV